MKIKCLKIKTHTDLTEVDREATEEISGKAEGGEGWEGLVRTRPLRWVTLAWFI